MKNKTKLEEALLNDLDPEYIVKLSLEDHEVRNVIRLSYISLLTDHDYNVSALIRFLGMSRQSFYNKMEKYEINLKRIRKINRNGG